MRIFLLPVLTLLFFGSPAIAETPPGEEGATAPIDPSQGEAKRLRDTLKKRARKNAWGGVESAYQKLLALHVDLLATDHMAGAEAAWINGDSWNAYQRLVMTIQIDENTADAFGRMKTLRDTYGRLTVRRVEVTAISFEKVQVPFSPDERASVLYAVGRLKETGGFDGLLPLGSYRIGDQEIEIVAGLQPVVVQRTVGDGQ